MKYNKTTSCEECRYALWDSIYCDSEAIDYIDGCEKGNKISDNNCKDYMNWSRDEISKFRIN